jgi:peptidylprolyl isomerase
MARLLNSTFCSFRLQYWNVWGLKVSGSKKSATLIGPKTLAACPAVSRQPLLATFDSHHHFRIKQVTMFRSRFNSRFATVAAAGLLTLISVFAVAQNAPDKDFASLPPKPSDVQQKLDALKVSLSQAIDVAQKSVNGKARSAELDLKEATPAYRVLVYAQGKAHRVVVNGETGAIASSDIQPYLPGASFDGDLTAQESGLQFIDLKVGEGEAVTESASVVLVNAIGFLVDGTEIINTTKSQNPEMKPEPVALPLKGMFPGFTEGTKGMKVGGKRKIVMPAALAYGERGNPPVIPANATLIFDIELLGVDPYSKIPTGDKLPGESVAKLDPVTTPSGLIYYDMHCGDGAQPAGPTSEVKVHYTGWLVDGKKFDSSHDHPGGEPFVTPLNRVVAGWTEGLQSMKVGGKRKLVIPYALGYGEFGRQGIPPQATLIFDIELLDVTEPPPTPPGAATRPAAPVPHDHDGDGHPDH